MRGKSIAVIGAGAAGVLAAYHLLSLQASVTIFEASSRARGRIDTRYPVAGSAAAYEMGAMRVPPSQKQLARDVWRVWGLPFEFVPGFPAGRTAEPCPMISGSLAGKILR